MKSRGGRYVTITGLADTYITTEIFTFLCFEKKFEHLQGKEGEDG